MCHMFNKFVDLCACVCVGVSLLGILGIKTLALSSGGARVDT